jgi:UPF0716 protein FxsA
MFVLLLMILWPVAELFVAFEVAQLIGVPATVLLLILAIPLGWWLVRHQGRAEWRRLQAAVAAGRMPGREVVGGALVLVGGALLIVPGFITDVLGLLLLLPPTRALARVGIQRNFRSRLVVRATRFDGPGSGYDVDSTASDIDPPPLPR